MSSASDLQDNLFLPLLEKLIIDFYNFTLND